MWTPKSGYSFSWIVQSRWQPRFSQGRARWNFPRFTTHARCSVANIPIGVLGTRVNQSESRHVSDTCGWANGKSCGFKNIRIRVDGASLFFFFEGKGRFVSRSLSNGDLFTCKVMMFRAKLTWYLIEGYIIKLIITFESLHLTLFRKWGVLKLRNGTFFHSIFQFEPKKQCWFYGWE